MKMTKFGNQLLLLLIGFMPLISFSQQDPPVPKEEVFHIVETMPEYPGGPEAMIKFIQQNIQYPDSARNEGIQGKVYVNFVVDSSGNITNVKILRGVHETLDKESIRVVKSMPKWKPGTQKGKPVRVSYNLPISFRID